MHFPPRLSTLRSRKDKFPKASKAAEGHRFVLQNHHSFTQTASALSSSCPPSPSPPLPPRITNQHFPRLWVRVPSSDTAPKTRRYTAWCLPLPARLASGRREPQSPKSRGGFKDRQVWGFWLQGEGKDIGRLDPSPALGNDGAWRRRDQRARCRDHREQHPKQHRRP